MALPQTVAEQLSRRSSEGPGWSGQLIMFSSALFAVSLFVYLGLIFGLEPYVNSRIQNLDQQIQQLGKQVSAEDQTQTIALYSQSVNLRNMFDSHIAASPILRFLEENTLANVFLTRLSLNIASRQITLGSVAKTLNDIAAQIGRFQSNTDLVDKVVLNNVTQHSSGAYQFDLVVTVTPKMFDPARIVASPPVAPVNSPAATSTGVSGTASSSKPKS